MRPDAEAETAIIDALYRGACDEGELMRAVDHIAEAFDVPSLLLGDLDLESPEKNTFVGAGIMDLGEADRYRIFGRIDPLMPLVSHLRPGTVGLSYRMINDAALRRHSFYDGFLRPLSIGHAMASPLHVSGSRIAVIALHQVDGRRRLDDDETMRLERLTPHIARVLHGRRAFLGLKRQQSTYAGIVDRSTTGLIGLARDGTILFVNPAMHALAAQGDGLLLDRRGLLILADKKASLSMARLQADVSSGGAGGYTAMKSG